MKNTLKAFLVAQALTLISGCSFEITNHNEFIAGETAADFLDDIFIQKDPEKAYSLTHELLQEEVPKEKFISELGELASLMDVKHINAESFELEQNSDVIAVYLTIETSADTSFIRVSTYGDGKNYKIISFKTIDSIPGSFDTSMAGTYKETGKTIERKSALESR